MTNKISYEAQTSSKPLSNFMPTPRQEWYSKRNMAAMFEAVKYLGDRELMFLKGITIRWIHAANVNFMYSVIKAWSINDKNCCAYASLDHYDYIPKFTANLKNRPVESREYFATNPAVITGVDFGVDIDFKEVNGREGSWHDAEDTLFDLLEIYRMAEVKYAVWKTTHGFHVVIPYSETQCVSTDVKKLRDFYYMIAIKLQKKFPEIDLSAYMETRVFRCPYMLDHQSEVILPLKFPEIKLLFDGKIKTEPIWVMNHIKMAYRGVFLNGKEGNFKKFVECVEND